MSVNKKWNAAVFVGSRHDQMCSIGSFARSETKAFSEIFKTIELIEPDEKGIYPNFEKLKNTPDVIFFHAPSLSDRKTPWGAIENAIKIRAKYPKAKFISIVHEFTEAPTHWRIRQALILKLSSASIANTESDHLQTKRFCKKILRSKLGPTLSFPELVKNPQKNTLKQMILENKKVLGDILENNNIKNIHKIILHPGLVTPGKGVNALKEFIPYMEKNDVLVVMGGLGPKARDREFAQNTKNELSQTLKGRFLFLENPNDELFSKILNAADLVLLPYDQGLSERRSSFLSAASCGANIFTTIGRFSSPMNPEKSGAHLVNVANWAERDKTAFSLFKNALSEEDNEVTKRRLSNLQWAESFSWDKRAATVYEFVSSILE